MTENSDDPYRWLEAVEDDRALDWVRARNEHSLGVIEGDARFAAIFEDAKAILTAADRIPYGHHENGRIHNFWQDDTHVRGILRRTSLASYCSDQPEWETELDLDALAEAQDENWVYHGCHWLKPDYDRCLLNLSPGGSDAGVLREFDVVTKSFVVDGFALPEGKNFVAWLDRDTLLIGTRHGGGPVNTSGYARTIRLWRRGTPIEAATLVFEAPEDDAFLYPYVETGPDGTQAFIIRMPDFNHQQVLAVEDGAARALELPDDIDFSGTFRGRLLVQLRSDWTVAGATFEAGSLVAIELGAMREDDLPVRVRRVAEPPARGSIAGAVATRDFVLVKMLDTVTSRLVAVTLDGDDWVQHPIDLPPSGSLHIVDGAPISTLSMAIYETFLVPTTLYLMDGMSAPRPIKSLPARIDPAPFTTEQHFATSADGTRVPYFVVRRRDAPLDGSTPTILYGYGGFKFSLDPAYVGPLAKTWLEHGGAWVVANIRGGGEFGPAWHKAAIKENRQRAFDDFHAVAEHLIETGLTRPARLGINGGSNGGLLVGVALTQRPDLYGAAVCSVPLLDMLRYHKLLAGASWIGEYGDPEIPEQRAYLARYSPYQNVRADADYPPVFLCTSTKDDRVHPGHARKMAARMIEQGHDVLYYENIEGGHSAAANLEQVARRNAQIAVFFLRTLAD